MLEPFSTPLVMRAGLRDPGDSADLTADSADPVWEFLFEHAANDLTRPPRPIRPLDLTADPMFARPAGGDGAAAPVDGAPEFVAKFWGKAIELSSEVLASPELTREEFFRVVASAYRVWRDEIDQDSGERN